MTSSTAPLIEALQLLDADLGALLTPALLDDAPRGMTDASILDLARTVESLGRRIDAIRIAIAGEVDDRSRSERGEARLSARLGCANAAELLVRLTRVATSTARERIAASRVVATRTSLTGDTLPAAFSSLREAAANGNVGVDTISAITRTLGSISDRCRLGEIEAAESELVRAAIGAADVPPCAADETRMQARVWAAVLDPDGALPEHERSMRRRGLVVGRERGGLTRVTGDLIPDVAAQLTRLLDAHLSPRVEDRTLTPVPNGPTFTPDAEVGSAPPDPRTRTQRQHDALAALLGAAARSAETPTLGGASPTLLVTIAASELESDHGIGHIDGTETTVPAYVARHVACSGGVQRLVFDDAGRVIELGSPQRVFTAAQRRAITARDGGCVIPGCHVPAAWCEFHHVEPHARGGSTHTDNGVMLCWFHHRTLATNGWAVAVIEGVPHVRAPRWLQPDGDWQPTTGSAHLQRQRLKRRRSSA